MWLVFKAMVISSIPIVPARLTHLQRLLGSRESQQTICGAVMNYHGDFLGMLKLMNTLW
jgi:hypothetical protein